MRKFSKYIIAGVAVGFLAFFSFNKLPLEAFKKFSIVKDSFKRVLPKEKPSNFHGYDVVTSASICVRKNLNSDDANS
ncbi:hypothetical protein J7L81_04390 [Candidatus Aerophobetes bacterium]|uniref:Uncharacterized protein n=1 Tax=Aerophobetes bacterium TaxID=2030807 RepID=A0A7V5LYU8_UNCAE|nr:hypothetical protein [Candidatus Aerophobetes bacterium]HHF97905.1 hypothetical protein [Candidatus Aerophobetes bacterium]